MTEQWKQHLRKGITFINFYNYYSVIKMVGKGSYGRVFLAEHLDEKKKYAVKVMEKSKIVSHIRGIETL